MATVSGTSGSDTLNGTSGNDTLNGLAGNDTLVGSGGTDFYDGGAGFDTLDVRVTMTGVAVNFAAGTISGGFSGTFVNMERVLGGNGGDSLIGAAGAQEFSGRKGNDTLAGGAGNDTLWGGGDADTFVFRETGAANADGIADFTSGSDKIVLDAGVMTALGASGNFAAGDARFAANSTGTAQDGSDRVIFNTTTKQLFYDADGNGSGAAVLVATLQSGSTLAATDIVVEGGSSGTHLVGTGGDDLLEGTPGDDTLEGLGGNDWLYGNDGADLMVGGDGNDTVNSLWDGQGDGFADTLDGGLGDDAYFINDDRDIILPDPEGVDRVDAELGSWTLGAGLENLDFRRFAGTGIGNELDNVMRFGATLWGMGGNDLLMTQAFQSGTSAHGGDGNDTLLGSGMYSHLFGDAGDDVLNAGFTSFADGNQLTGGAGADRFIFDERPGDTLNMVTDFTTGSDRIVLDGDAHADIGASGDLAAGDARFFAGAGATSGQDANDRVIYNTSTGQLWYDADGNGPGSGRLIATLQGAPTLVATDISVVDGGTGINGTAGDDSLAGTRGNDTINGRGGDDTIDGQGGEDTIDGGDGNDSIRGGDGDDRIDGDTVDFGGAPGNDYIDGGPGNDGIHGWEGDDTLIGGAGDDVFMIDSGSSDFSIRPGNDSIDGGDGIDGISFGIFEVSSTGPVVIDLQAGTYSIADRDGEVTGVVLNVEDVYGSSGSDWIKGTNAPNWLSGVEGNDTIEGLAGDDLISLEWGLGAILRGGAGNDTITVSEGEVSLVGGEGNDHLEGGIFSSETDSFLFDVAPGAANADTIDNFQVGSDKVVLDGNAHANIGPSGDFTAGDARFWSSGTGTAHDADDRVIYNTTSGELWYDADGSGSGAAQLIATLHGAPALVATDIAIVNGSAGSGQVINGTAGSDTLQGGPGNDTLNGLGGNDTLIGSGGTDFYDGGAGSDTLDVRATMTGVTVSFASGTMSGGFSGTFANIERVLGGNGADSLIGAAGAQTLSSRMGDDTLAGGAGIDTLWGGGGADTFIFREMGTANADRISDFATGSDKLHLDDSAFTAIGATGNFAAGDGRFWAAAGATAGHDANDRVIFNTSTGALYYDADGSGAGAAQLIATVQSGATVAATDIVVI